jgi:hypothetical protein
VNIYGFDFTSVPGPRKPITCAVCQLAESTLTLHACIKLRSFEEFEAFLNRAGPWLAALDFPFGQPRKLISRLGWPETWEGYVQLIAAMGKHSFEHTLTQYCASRPPGDKHHSRVTDVLAASRSPMMLHRVPVAKMFFQGAPRLLASGVSILPSRPTHDNRVVVEGYPALVARRWIDRRSYKSDERAQQTTAKAAARQAILRGLCSPGLLDYYGCAFAISTALVGALIEDPMADSLDALLCAVQAAWAYSQRNNGYGIPPHRDPLEGWIVDPAVLYSELHQHSRNT